MTTPGSETPLARILRKVNAKQALTAGELKYYQRMREIQRGLPDITNTTVAPNSSGGGGSVGGSFSDNDRGADPAWQAAHPASAAPGLGDLADILKRATQNVVNGITQDRGADPAFQAAHPGGYAPSLDQEQAQAQHNANSQGGTSYIPNTASGGTVDATGTPSGDTTLDTITHLPDEQMPNLPKVTLTWHDFTDQAKQKVAGAYAPLYAAINQGKQDATARSANVSAQDKGMYQDLAHQNAVDKGATAQRYQSTANNARTNGKQLLDTLAGGAQSADAELAKTMADAGLGSGRQGTAAADILSQQIGNEGAATQQAQVANANNLQNIGDQRNNQLDYQTNVAQADARQGEATQEGVANDLTSQLSDFTQQGLQTKANQAQAGLDLNQQMSQNDWTAQTGGADQTWNAYNAAMGQYTAKVNQDQANTTLQNQAAAAQADAAAAQAKLDQDAAQNAAANALAADKIDLENKQAQAAQAAKDAQDAAQDKIDQQNADSRTTTAGAAAATAAGKTQGTNPNAPNYNPLQDPTSPEYLAAHNSQALYSKTLLGITGGNQQQATALDTMLSSVYASLADMGSKIGNASFASQAFKSAAIARAKALNLPENAAAQAVDAWLKEHPTS